MARLLDDTDPMPQADDGAARSTTDERVIGSLLDGLDAPQPVVRTRDGRPASARDATPTPERGIGDRNAPTALLPIAEQRQKRRRLFASIAIAAAIVIIVFVGTTRWPKEEASPSNAPAVTNIPANRQMNISPATATAAYTAVPTVSLSSLPAANAAPTATSAGSSDRPHTPTRAVTTPTPTNAGGHHAEIKEDTL